MRQGSAGAHSMIRSLGLNGDRESRPSRFTTWKKGPMMSSLLDPRAEPGPRVVGASRSSRWHPCPDPALCGERSWPHAHPQELADRWLPGRPPARSRAPTHPSSPTGEPTPRHRRGPPSKPCASHRHQHTREPSLKGTNKTTPLDKIHNSLGVGCRNL